MGVSGPFRLFLPDTPLWDREETMTLTVQEKAERALKIMAEEPIVVFDVETTGLDWKRDKPIGYVVGSPGHKSVYVPIRHEGGGNLLGQESVYQGQFGLEAERCHGFENDLGAIIRLRGTAHRYGTELYCRASHKVRQALCGQCRDIFQKRHRLHDGNRSSLGRTREGIFSRSLCRASGRHYEVRWLELYKHIANMSRVCA